MKIALPFGKREGLSTLRINRSRCIIHPSHAVGRRSENAVKSRKANKYTAQGNENPNRKSDGLNATPPAVV
jgi:hypothetical protein